MKKLTIAIFVIMGTITLQAQKNIQIGSFNVSIVGEQIGTRNYNTSIEEYYLGYRNDSLFYSEVWTYVGGGNTASYTGADIYTCALSVIDKDDLGIEQVIGEGYEYWKISLWTNFKDKKQQFLFREYKEESKKVKKSNESFKTIYADNKQPLEALRSKLK